VDRFAFVYGNVKPDISKMANLKHHFEETFPVFYTHMQAAQNTALSTRERSLALGVACHFLCDYFCKYHAKQPYRSANIVLHLYYELKLHFAAQRQIRRDRENTETMDIDGALFLGHSPEHVKRHMLSRIAFYERHPEAYATDIHFAFGAIRQLIGELMRVEKTEEAYDAHSDFYGYVPSAS
jgi:hypothetical protein